MKSTLRIAGAAGIYFIFSMTSGFVLGPIRELAFVPMFGRAAGTLIEAALMLPAIFGAAWGALRICRVSPRTRDRAVVGGISLLLVLTAEIGLSPLVWGSVANWVATFTSATLVGTVVLWAAQACAPLVVSRRI
jgi:hypothetical protein